MRSYTHTTISGLEQLVCCYSTPLDAASVKVDVRPQECGDEELLARHAQEYATGITIPHWREIVLAMEGSYPEFDPCEFAALTTTSYHAQYLRDRSRPHTHTPLAFSVLLRTADDKFAYGVRGGQVMTGKVQGPGGSLAPLPGELLLENILLELREELGIVRGHYVPGERPLLLGHQSDPESSRSWNFVIYARTRLHASALQHMHARAYDMYSASLRAGFDELQARRQLRRSGAANVDAWEHTQLYFLEDDVRAMERCIADRAVTLPDGQTYQLLDIGRTALMVYLEHRNANSE